MPTELTQLELMEVSLVDAGDDPHAKVSLFKRHPQEGESMTDETTDDLLNKEDTTEEEECMDDDEEMVEGEDKKPTRKSWKSEAETLAQYLEEAVAKIAELEAAAVEKAKPKEEMIDVDGEMVAKSAVPAPVLKKLEELEKAKEAEELRKRADEVLPNFKGTPDQRGKLLKSVGEDEDLLEMLRAADALFASLFDEVGKTDAKNDLKTPAEKFEDMVKAKQAETKDSYHKAYAAISKTAEGRALLKEINKK